LKWNSNNLLRVEDIRTHYSHPPSYFKIVEEAVYQ
jgi:hypothetical protein